MSVKAHGTCLDDEYHGICLPDVEYQGISLQDADTECQGICLCGATVFI
jgi:hypothetical protein